MPPPDAKERGASSARAVPSASRSMLPRPAVAAAVAAAGPGRPASWSVRDWWTCAEVSPGGLLLACRPGMTPPRPAQPRPTHDEFPSTFER
jgi:hypothetical protein